MQMAFFPSCSVKTSVLSLLKVRLARSLKIGSLKKGQLLERQNLFPGLKKTKKL